MDASPAGGFQEPSIVFVSMHAQHSSVKCKAQPRTLRLTQPAAHMQTAWEGPSGPGWVRAELGGRSAAYRAAHLLMIPCRALLSADQNLIQPPAVQVHLCAQSSLSEHKHMKDTKKLEEAS